MNNPEVEVKNSEEEKNTSIEKPKNTEEINKTQIEAPSNEEKQTNDEVKNEVEKPSEHKESLESKNGEEEKTNSKDQNNLQNSSEIKSPFPISPSSQQRSEENKIDPWSTDSEKNNRKRDRVDLINSGTYSDGLNEREPKKLRSSRSPIKREVRDESSSSSSSGERKSRVDDQQLRTVFGRTDKSYSNYNNRFRGRNDYRRNNNNNRIGGPSGGSGGSGNYVNTRPVRYDNNNFDYRRRYNRDYENWQGGGQSKPFYDKRNNNYEDRRYQGRENNFQRNQSYNHGGNYNNEDFYNNRRPNYENRSNFRQNDGFYRNKNYEGGRYSNEGYNGGGGSYDNNVMYPNRQNNYREPNYDNNYPPRTEIQQSKRSPPLPPGWRKYHTEDGKPYYYDETTQTSHWEKPRLTSGDRNETKPTSSSNEYFNKDSNTNFRNKYPSSINMDNQIDRQRDTQRNSQRDNNNQRDNNQRGHHREKYDNSTQRKYDNLQNNNNNNSLSDKRGGSQTRYRERS